MVKQHNKEGMMIHKLIMLSVVFSVCFGYAQAWEPTDSLNGPRCEHTATLLMNGKVLVAGGWRAGHLRHKSCELYDPISGTWRYTDSLNVGRGQHAAVMLQDGRVLVIGGCGDSGYVPLGSCEIYDPYTETWEITGTLNKKRLLPQAVVMNNDGRVLVVGGLDSALVIQECEIYDPSTGTWSLTSNLLPPRAGHALSLLPDGRGKVLSAGGMTYGGVVGCQIYDPSTGNWTPTGQLNYNRFILTLTLLDNDKILAVGGVSSEDGLSHPVQCELYDYITGTWSITGSISPGRHYHACAKLQDGKVLLVDGRDGGGWLNDCELYDPGTGLWTDTEHLNPKRELHTLTLLDDGRALAAGGMGPPVWISDCQLYGTMGRVLEQSSDALSRIKVAPNPFITAIVISFPLSISGPLSLSIYDVTGKVIRQWDHQTIHPAPASRGGVQRSKQIIWYGDDERGFTVPAGIYIVLLKTSKTTTQMKVLKVR